MPRVRRSETKAGFDVAATWWLVVKLQAREWYRGGEATRQNWRADFRSQSKGIPEADHERMTNRGVGKQVLIQKHHRDRHKP